MSWGDMLGGLAKSVAGSALGGQIVQALGPSVLNGVLDQLNRNGLGGKVNSWLGRGENQPITAEELREALGNAQLQDMARKFGVPVDQLLQGLAQHLPAAVDHASPNGVFDPAAV